MRVNAEQPIKEVHRNFVEAIEMSIWNNWITHLVIIIILNFDGIIFLYFIYYFKFLIYLVDELMFTCFN